MRPQSWISTNKKIRTYAPPEVKARNVYELKDRLLDRDGSPGLAVLVVAPGPSFASFPKEELARHTTIAVNSALELFTPTFWTYVEPFFTKRYRQLYGRSDRPCIVTTRSQALGALEHVLPLGPDLFWFRYGANKRDPEDNFSVLKMSRTRSGERPWWCVPGSGFLPGRCSVATHAVSLAVLMGASTVVTVGVDFRYEAEDAYYAAGVEINPGPRRKAKALASGRAWAALAAKRGVWDGAEILTVSPAGGLPGARRVTVEEAVERMREVNR